MALFAVIMSLLTAIALVILLVVSESKLLDGFKLSLFLKLFQLNDLLNEA